MGIFSFLSGKKSSQWANLSVTKKDSLSPTFTVFTLVNTNNEPFSTSFIPGQYVTLSAEIEGKEIRRSYSICGAEENGFKIGVKKIDGGLMSSFLHDHIEKGSEIKVHVPEGSFVLNGEQTICAFVAGSGVTPLASMLEQYQSQKKFKVFYGIKKAEDYLFKPLLEKANARVYVSQEHVDGFRYGRLTYDAMMEELKMDLSLLQCDVYLLCGPEEFMNEIERGLTFFGVPENKIKREFFVSPVASNDKELQTGKYTGPVSVVATIDGKEHSFTYQSGKKSLLEGLEEARLDPPYSCRGGVCSSCRAKLTAGKVIMRQNYTLTDKEVEEGYVLTCQADACSGEIQLTFDA